MKRKLLFQTIFYVILGAVCVCNRLASGISADGINFATSTYIKREFDSKMSRQNSLEIERKNMMLLYGT